MSADHLDSPTDQALVVASRSAVKVQEVDGKKVLRLPFEASMQGHTFAVDLRETSVDSIPTGPFRLEFVLGTEFAIHEAKLPSSSFEDGFSHLAMSSNLARLRVHLTYSDTDTPSDEKEAVLLVRGSDEMVQRLVVETPESDLEKAIRHTGQIVADLLDALSLLKRVPLSVRHIDVHTEGVKYQRRYMTLPYGSRGLTTDDLSQAHAIPRRVRPAVRLFREGVSSNRPPYRLLCLYRVREVIDAVRRKNDQEVMTSGATPRRTPRRLPSNELTRRYFPDYVGKKVGAFLDHVRSEYRLPVAHGSLDEYFRLVLDPANVRVDHRIDWTNAALMPVVAEMIEDEISFMNQHRLEESDSSSSAKT